MVILRMVILGWSFYIWSFYVWSFYVWSFYVWSFYMWSFYAWSFDSFASDGRPSFVCPHCLRSTLLSLPNMKIKNFKYIIVIIHLFFATGSYVR